MGKKGFQTQTGLEALLSSSTFVPELTLRCSWVANQIVF